MAVPYNEKEAFKSSCIKQGVLYGWDKAASTWYIETKPDIELGTLTRWEVHSQPTVSATRSSDVVSQFAAELEQAGLIVAGDPIMDGALHRVPVVDARRGKKDGAYVGYLDGIPNGWYENHRTGVSGKWKSGATTVLTTEDRAAFAQRKLERQNEMQQRHAAKLKELPDKLASYDRATENHPYVQRKQVYIFPDTADQDIRVNKLGSLVIPLYNMDGELQSAQWISADGQKGIYEDTVKSGTFLFVSGRNCMMDTPDICRRASRTTILIAEGWSTAKTISECSGLDVICAVDAANIVTVAKAWRTRCPDANIVICGDDDKEVNPNKGRIFAAQAACEVGGTAIFPDFPARISGTDFNDFYVEYAKLGKMNQARKIIRNQVIDATRSLIFSRSKNHAQAPENGR